MAREPQQLPSVGNVEENRQRNRKYDEARRAERRTETEKGLEGTSKKIWQAQDGQDWKRKATIKRNQGSAKQQSHYISLSLSLLLRAWEQWEVLPSRQALSLSHMLDGKARQGAQPSQVPLLIHFHFHCPLPLHILCRALYIMTISALDHLVWFGSQLIFTVEDFWFVNCYSRN